MFPQTVVSIWYVYEVDEFVSSVTNILYTLTRFIYTIAEVIQTHEAIAIFLFVIF